MTEAEQTIRQGTAVVTGAGSGLGRALAVELVSNGVHVAGFGRRLDALEETAALAGPDLFTPLVVDVADPDAVIAAFEQLDNSAAPVRLLINNAATYERFDFLERPAASYMESVSVNLGGVIACSHAALTRMTQTGVGRIVNVATFADLWPLPGSSAYSVSKGAARIFTRALVADIADRFPDIVINDWIPGALATPMGLADGLKPEVSAKWGVELALWHDPSLTGTTFDRDTEHLPPSSLKRRIKNLVLMRRGPAPRRLGTGSRPA